MLLGLIAIGLASCRPEENFSEQSISLQLIDSRTIPVPEASGLSYDSTNNMLLTVSDGDRDMVYRLTTDGTLVDSIYLGGGDMDLEGICARPDGLGFLVVEEGNRNIVEYSAYALPQLTIHVDFPGPENSGLEGIAVDFPHRIFYVVNEKNPAVIFKLDSSGNILSQRQVNEVSDLSGLVFLPEHNLILAASDQSGMVIAFTPDLSYTGHYAMLDFQSAEGIAVKGDTLFIVTDTNSPNSGFYRFIYSIKNP